MRLSPRSVAIVQSAQHRLNDAKWDSIRRLARTHTPEYAMENYVDTQEFRLAEQMYDIVIDTVPEWSEARRRAKHTPNVVAA